MNEQISNQQAANELKAMQEHVEPYMSIVGLTAYNMAIKALEQTSYKSEARRWKRRYLDLKQRTIKLEEQQSCEDAISREEALKVMCDKCPMHNCVTGCSSYRHIEKMPSVTPSRPRGRWIREKRDFLLVYRCSNCKNFIYSREPISDVKYEDLSRVDSHRYCSRCGADMRESEDKK